MSQSKISILIATYNRPHLLEKAIRSALDQTAEQLEVIVVDDSTNDETERAMRDWIKKDSRIKYFRPGHKGRIAIVSNVGLRESKGEYIAILDDDDYWADAKKLEKQAKFLDENPAYVGCGGGFIVINERGEERGRFLKPISDADIRRRALLANPMVNSTTMFRRDVAMKLGGYDETMLEFADWDFWLKMGLAGKLHNFSEYFTYYLMWDKGSSFSKQAGTAASGLRITRRYRNDYPLPFLGIALAYAYYAYTRFPDPVKRVLNPILSRLKKALFSR